MLTERTIQDITDSPIVGILRLTNAKNVRVEVGKVPELDGIFPKEYLVKIQASGWLDKSSGKEIIRRSLCIGCPKPPVLAGLHVKITSRMERQVGKICKLTLTPSYTWFEFPINFSYGDLKQFVEGVKPQVLCMMVDMARFLKDNGLSKETLELAAEEYEHKARTTRRAISAAKSAADELAGVEDMEVIYE